jgi:hypothetical protein
LRQRPKRRLALHLFMESLSRPPRFRMETLLGSAVGNAPIKEAAMLDVAFVAVGVAFLGLMGVYALALRQL